MSAAAAVPHELHSQRTLPILADCCQGVVFFEIVADQDPSRRPQPALQSRQDPEDAGFVLHLEENPRAN